VSHALTVHQLDAPLAIAKRTLADAFEQYPGRVTLACSFGGPTGMVLLDLALQMEPRVPVFCLDTQLLFPETYALVERVEQHYGIDVTMVRPGRTVEQQAAEHGPALWSRDPDRCCELRKVEPLRAYLRDFDAWLTGLRRDQSDGRAQQPRISWDEQNEVVKIAPLVSWTTDDVWAYIGENDVPVNTLHFEGYPSIGCTHCTRSVAPDEHARAGRWSGFDKTECGIHLTSEARA
jgi:phosphoadenosine phosphosulfate reductase